MKKLVLAFASIAVSGVASAEIPQPAETSALDNVKLIASAGIKVVGDDLLAKKPYTKVEPVVGVTASFNDNYYFGGTFQLDKNNYADYGMKAGIAQNVGLFRPYVELNSHVKRQTLVTEEHSTDEDGNDVVTTNTSHRYIQTVGYSAGIHLAINKNIVPYVQVNNFVQEGKMSLEAGAQVNLMDNIGCNVSFQYGPHNSWHQANVNVTYAF